MYLCNGSCRQVFQMPNVYKVAKSAWTNSRKKILWMAIRWKTITSYWDSVFCWLGSFTCIVTCLACSSALLLQTSLDFVDLPLVRLGMAILTHFSSVKFLLFNGRCYYFSAVNISLVTHCGKVIFNHTTVWGDQSCRKKNDLLNLVVIYLETV